MKTLALCATFGLLAASAPAFSGETPHPTAQDNRIREVVYSDAQVFRVVGVFRSATQIVFSAGERVERVALGDTVSWEVAPAENSLFIKPRELAGSTNLIVLTRSSAGIRTYTFELPWAAAASMAASIISSGNASAPRCCSASLKMRQR